MDKDYGEILCESIKIISESLLQDLQYDQTIICTIIDDSEASEGKYRVSNGSASFIAYSTEKYSNNNNVYVTIPKGDYNNDKLIIGKVSQEDLKVPYNYAAPFDVLLDITGNLWGSNKDGSLLANDESKATSIYLGTISSDELGDGGLEGFTRLGLRASFRSLLQEYNCIGGDYGLELQVTFETKDGNDIKNSVKYLYLNSEDMVGNPYNFETFFVQEKLFDITDLGAVTKIDIYFKQAGNFIDNNKQYVPYLEEEAKDEEGNPIGLEQVKLFDNLFVKDIWIALGYDLQEQEGEFVQLYTLDPLSYSPKKTKEENQRSILLRWLHNGTNGKYQIDENSTEDFEIRWYRYKLGASAADEYCGVNWELINNNPDDNDTLGKCGRRFKAILDPDIASNLEQIKVIILYGPAPGYYEYNPNPFQNVEDFKANYYKAYYIQNKTIPSENEDEEDIIRPVLTSDNPKDGDGTYRAVFNQDKDAWTTEDAEISWDKVQYYYKVDERQTYRSEPIVFTNEVNVPSKATLEALSALELKCYDLVNVSKPYELPTYGNYLLYNEQNDLIDRSQSNIQRLIVWKLNIENYDPEGVSKVVWNVPDEKTSMLRNVNIDWKESSNEAFSQGITYYINGHYSVSNSNNNIGCSVTYNGVTYSGTQELTFGQAGTMGASATFVLDFVGDQRAITLEDIGKQLKIKAIVYDENNKLIEDLSGYSIKWDWFTAPSIRKPEAKNYIDFVDIEPSGEEISIQGTQGLNINDSCYILQATLSGWNNTSSNTSYDLTAYLPIPVRTSYDYTYITGADRVIYLSDGTPEYYKSHYIMHHKTEEDKTDGWSLKTYYSYNNDGTIINDDPIYHPVLKSTTSEAKTIFKLSPSPLYFEGSAAYHTVTYTEKNAVQWSQPILIIQSRYFSSMVNDWDGRTIHFDEEGGDILASRIGAGRKNEQNQFSGVLLGDWGTKANNSISTQTTGLFGFRDGLLSFGFKDDGTAFIGTKAAGQLQFDGGSSTITSASYRDGQSNGMLLDFDNPKILMRQGSSDTIRVGKRITDVYTEYGTFNKEIDWKDIGRTDLYKKNSDGSYTQVNKWSTNYETTEGVVLYEKTTANVGVLPFNGISTEEQFKAKLTEYEVSYFQTLNSAGNALVNVSTWDGQLYNKDTYFYYPGAEFENRTINMNATADINPLTVGSKFKVNWDGTLYAEDGEFTGTINAIGGTIRGTLQVQGTLSGGYIYGARISGSRVSTTYLYADNGQIGGWKIGKGARDTKASGIATVVSYLEAEDQKMGLYSNGVIKGGTLTASLGQMELIGYLKIDEGYFGRLNSDETKYNDKGEIVIVQNPGIGMFYGTPRGDTINATVEATSEIKATSSNCGLKYGKSYLSCYETGISIGVGNLYNADLSKEEQDEKTTNTIAFNGPLELLVDWSYGESSPEAFYHEENYTRKPRKGQLYFKILS